MVGTLGTLVTLGGAGAMAWAVRGRSSRIFGRSVHQGTRVGRKIALTFDDGPSEGTLELLDVLALHKVHATFFMCGMNVERCPQIAREVVRRGHEVGNHTQTHARLDFKSSEFIYREVAGAQEAIIRVTGITPRWFRAPYGVRWPGLGGVQERLGLTGVMWTCIARDWKLEGPEVAGRIYASARPGAIVCLHDGRVLEERPDIRSTIEGVKRVIPQLRSAGYVFGTVSEIRT